MPSHCASACVPRRTVRLNPSPGRSLRTGSKPNSRARAATAGYCVTTATRSNTPAGTASNARRMSGLPSSSASSLFAPKRTAFPAAMMTQPSMVIPPVCIDRGRPPPEFVPAPLRMEQAPSLSLRALRARKPCRLALPLGELAAQPPERETWLSLCLLLPFERACKALSVTFGDSSPRGRAKDLQLNHNDAGGKRSQACSCVPPQKPAQVQPDIRPFSMPFSCVAICPAMRKRLRVREIKHTVRGRNNHGKTKT